jgi:hypothetical protein
MVIGLRPYPKHGQYTPDRGGGSFGDCDAVDCKARFWTITPPFSEFVEVRGILSFLQMDDGITHPPFCCSIVVIETLS